MNKQYLNEQRMQMISEINPIWAVYITEFIANNQQFAPYLYLASLTDKPVDHQHMPTTVKQAILYYICFAGVNSNYGQKCWLQVKDMKTAEDILHSKLSNKKKEYLSKAILLKDDLSLEEFVKMKISGIGIGGINYIKRQFSEVIEKDLVEYTDIGIQKGMQIIYNLDKRPTPTQARKIAESWGEYSSVGHMFCNQVYHYL